MTDVETKEEVQENTPYKGKDRIAALEPDKPEEPENLEIIDSLKEDTQEGFLQKQKEAQDHDWKKRYSDLKSYHDRKNNEWTQQQELAEAKLKLAEQKASHPDVLPKSPEELEEFKKEYPDVYNVVETVAKLQSTERMREVETRLEELKKSEQESKVRIAEKELLSLHPDFIDIKDSPEFLSWLDDQPASIADGIRRNRTDAKWASRVLDLFKIDNNISQKKRGRPKKSNVESAAEAVTKTEKVTVAPEGEARIWTSEEIAKLKPHQFEKLESEIDKASREGRIK